MNSSRFSRRGCHALLASSSVQLSVLTHLDLPVEAHCRSSFFVDSSSLVSYPLPLCLSSLSFAQHCWAAADLDAVLAVSGPGGTCCCSWALTLLLLALLYTRSQTSLFIVQSVDDAFFLVSHRLLSVSSCVLDDVSCVYLCRIFPQRGNCLPPGTADLQRRH